MNAGPTGIENLLRHHAPQVLGALVRRYGHFDTAEDAVQEAMLAAYRQWPVRGLPENPRGWLIRTASRRLTDQLRHGSARRRREEKAAALTPRDAFTAPPNGESRAPSADDTLTLLFLRCHPELSPAAQIALTPRAVGGLTAEIARAHLVPEATMAMGVPPCPSGYGGGSAGPSRRCGVCRSGSRGPPTATSGSRRCSRCST